MKIFFHGDVILKEVATVPQGFSRVESVQNGFVLERGEGRNTHRVQTMDMSEMADKVEIFTNDAGAMCVKVKEPIHITHEEHGTEVIEKGIYLKDIETQFDYENLVERKVTD